MLRSSQAHIWINVLIISLLYVPPAISNQSDIDDEVPTTLKLIGHDPDFVPYRSNITMICKTRLVASTLWWTFKDANLTEDSQYILEREAENINPELDKTYEISILHILDVDFSHTGEYKCHAIKVTDEGSELDFAKITLNLAIDVSIVEFSSSPPSADILPVESSESDNHRLSIRAKLHDAMRLSCTIDGYPMLEVGWRKDGQIISPEMAESINTTTIAVQDMPTNGTRWYTEIIMSHLERRDNGTYECYGKTAVSEDDQKMAILVLDKPQVSIESVKAIGRSSIYLQWRVNDGNAPDGLHYRVQYTTPGGEHWHYYRHDINGTLRSAVLRDAFTNNTAYTIRLAAINSEGESPYATSMDLVVTLAEDPVFVPLVKVTGVTVSSITISWTEPGPAVAPYIHYYHLTSQLTPNHPTVTGDTGTNATSGNVTEMDSLSAPLEAIVPAREGHHLYMLSDLRPATTYKFQVAACSEYSRECGPQSVATLGTTNDGMAGPPVSVHAECRYDVASGTSAVLVTWRAPAEPNGRIVSYNVNLEGNATFINDLGLVEETTWGPKVTSISASTLMARFYNVSANTNYTVRVAAVTRAKRNGVLVERHCRMPVTLPDRQRLAKVTWRKLETEDGRWIFKVQVPRVSERNGPICCYRVYLVRMESQQTLAELPAPAQLEVVSFREAHRTPKGGAYVAEMFTSSSFHNEVFLGDDQQIYNDTTNALGLTTITNAECDQCIGLRPYNSPAAANDGHGATAAAPVLTTQPSTVASVSSKENNATSAQQNRVRREQLSDPLPPRDGLLDYNSNYTSFVEIVVHDPEQSTVESSNGNNLATLAAYSSYLVMMNPGPEVVEAPPASSTRLVVQVLCGLVFVVLVLVAALCLLREYTKQAHAQAVEMITFRTSLRNLRGRQRLISLNPPDMCPIPLNSLTAAYLERHRDSDYGFQQEFELLPDRFTDRTTRASDARENVYKNRYPDIKAYDQTRVKLSQVDSIAGSDYVNANFVLGYKERRKFICAQGPMDTTVTEFWRMIWEQHLELVLMLTNLEEYSKTKCAKYWPDKADIDKVFGDFTVTHVSETRYSDYILRELRVTLRRNGGGNNGTLAAAMSSSPTSPLAAHCEEESRTIVQYHYLVWKDFMAPEHPHGIIRFIKRMNEAATHSAPEERGAILVHCSAGVGRTGTLVALDCLLQQLHDEGQVAIFNTICELRHQRNFLVQSLKQFIFIYRALMEVSQYGDTEIPISELKSTVEKLKICDKDKVRSKMEDDFENIRNAYEDRKSCSVASGVENQDKNRCDTVIPYDRNRVILTPLSGREHSTYINATFIEGYDNSESFIIAQDPLECTIPDFWRMIAEQGISVVVMLSELGDNKCPRYWPEDERCYDHITVRYVQAESCPYYTRREMFVRSRDGEDVRVVHLQYHGWPTVDGEVPEVTRGLIELVDHAQSALTPHGSPTTSPTSMVVHCHMGADRSSMFVALSILVQQLRVERRADIFTVTRKLRSQRQEMISTYPQYEFLHRAIVNYAELHGLCDT